MIEREWSSYRYLNSRLRETEEELDRERGKSAWDKFREKHHIFKKKSKTRLCYKKNWWEKHGEQIVFLIYGAIWIVVAVFLFNWSLNCKIKL